MLITTLDEPPEGRLAQRLARHHQRGREPLDGLVRMALSGLRASPGGLARETVRRVIADLRRYEAARIPDLDEALDRTVEALGNRLGRCPAAAEIATAAGVTVEDVLDELERARGARTATRVRERQALFLRCTEGLERDAIAARMGVRRLEVSRLLRRAAA